MLNLCYFNDVIWDNYHLNIMFSDQSDAVETDQSIYSTASPDRKGTPPSGKSRPKVSKNTPGQPPPPPPPRTEYL